MTLGGPGGDRTAVVAALRAVAGVADAEILPDESGGPGTLRLQLTPGADEVLVATTVHRLLGERFGLGVDAGRVQVVEEAMARRPRIVGSSRGGGTDRTNVQRADEQGADEQAGHEAAGDEQGAAEQGADEHGGDKRGAPAQGGQSTAGEQTRAGEPSDEHAAADRASGDHAEAGNRTSGQSWPPSTVLSAVSGRGGTGVQGRRGTPQFPRPESGPALVPTEPASQGRSGKPAATLGPVADLDRVEETGLPRGTRLLIHRMQLVSASRGVTSEVTLELAGSEHTGTAGAASTPSSVHRAVALATLRAVEGALDGAARFELEHLETTTLGADRAVIIEVAMITKHGSERLTGVSSVREDARQAVIRATLDAVNRRIETYLVPA